MRQRRVIPCSSLPSLRCSFLDVNASSTHGAELSLIDLYVVAKRRTQSRNAILSLLLTLPPSPHPKHLWGSLSDAQKLLWWDKEQKDTWMHHR